MSTWRDVRRFALALPGTSEQIRSNGASGWVVNDKLFVRERPLRPADLEMKEAPLGSNPCVYFTTPHFDGYPAVLVKLDAIGAKELKDVRCA
jgi:hypothetical protein